MSPWDSLPDKGILYAWGFGPLHTSFDQIVKANNMIYGECLFLIWRSEI